MHYFVVVLMLLVIAMAEESPEQPASAPYVRLVAAVLGMAIVSLSAFAVAWWTSHRLRRHFTDRQRISASDHWLRVGHASVLLGVYAATIFVFRWDQLVRSHWGLQGTIWLDELLIFAPVLVPLIVSWAAFYEVERTLREEAARRAGRDATPWSRRQYVGYQLRHNLGVVMIPVLLVIGALDGVRLWVPTHYQAAVVSPLIGGLLMVLLLVFPVVLRFLWKARSMPVGPLRTRLEQLGQRAGFHCSDILIWNTSGAVVNAAVVGFLPWLRYILFSDGLTKCLATTEIEAVFGHEIGHVKHRHLLLRLLAVIPLVGILGIMENVISPELWLDIPGLPVGTQATLIVLTVAGLYLWIVFGYFSRRLERQADIFACRTTSCGHRDCPPHDDPNSHISPQSPLPTTLCSTSIRTFVGLLEKLTMLGGVSRNTPSWQHFSIGRRIRFLEDLLYNPAAEQQLQRSVRRLQAALAATIATMVTYLGWSWVWS